MKSDVMIFASGHTNPSIVLSVYDCKPSVTVI